MAQKYEIIKEHIISVDKTGKGHYVELMGLNYNEFGGYCSIQCLSEENPNYCYRSRFMEYLRWEGKRDWKIVTDVIESVYHNGERIK